MEIRFANKSDAVACNNFYNSIYCKKRSLLQWEWEFLQRDLSDNVLPYILAIEQGQIVGTQAFIPIKMIDDKGIFLAAKSEETLVAPKYRGKKLFEKMYLLLFDFMKNHGLHCVWGFTGAQKAFRGIGFIILQTTSQLFFPFTGLAIPAQIAQHTAMRHNGIAARFKGVIYRCASASASLYSMFQYRYFHNHLSNDILEIDIRLLDAAPLQSDDVSERFITLFGGLTIHRDSKYLQWRIFSNPYIKAVVRGAFKHDQLVGWIAYAMGDDGMGYIVDIMVAPLNKAYQEVEKITRRLMVEAVGDLLQTGALGVRGWTVNNHPFNRVLLDVAKSIGFYHIKRGSSMVLYVNPESDRRGKLAMSDYWFLSRIYTEGIYG